MTTNQQPWAGVAPIGPMLRPKDAAQHLGYSVSRYYALAADGKLPKPIAMGEERSSASAVPQSWLDAIIAHRVAIAEVGS